uniref:Uncharacterized protein n=1 Tax=Roseihalotalea indica TaxID=2867963 RepID=A0AA49GQK5_9BACT|nr:hypothetical protein K4G66_10800 [Tunicatimonas sp. TK19036]
MKLLYHARILVLLLAGCSDPERVLYRSYADIYPPDTTNLVDTVFYKNGKIEYAGGDETLMILQKVDSILEASTLSLSDTFRLSETVNIEMDTLFRISDNIDVYRYLLITKYLYTLGLYIPKVGTVFYTGWDTHREWRLLKVIEHYKGKADTLDYSQVQTAIDKEIFHSLPLPTNENPIIEIEDSINIIMDTTLFE